MNYISQVNIGEHLFNGPHFLRQLTGIGRLITALISNAFVIAGIVFLLLILIAGFNMISAGGDTQKFARAQQIITTAILGFIIVIAAFMVVRIIDAIFGLKIIGI